MNGSYSLRHENSANESLFIKVAPSIGKRYDRLTQFRFSVVAVRNPQSGLFNHESVNFKSLEKKYNMSKCQTHKFIGSTELPTVDHHDSIKLSVRWCAWKVGEGFPGRVSPKTLKWAAVYSSVTFHING